MMLVFLLKLYSFSSQKFIASFMIYIYMYKTRLKRVVDETTRGYGLGAKRLERKWYWGAKRLKVKNRGETTRGETTRGEMSWGRNVLLPKTPLNRVVD